MTSLPNSFVDFITKVCSPPLVVDFVVDPDLTVLSSSDDVEESWLELLSLSIGATFVAAFVDFFFFLTTRRRGRSFDFTIGGALDGLDGVLVKKCYNILHFSLRI